jgi:hypothetical protein
LREANIVVSYYPSVSPLKSGLKSEVVFGVSGLIRGGLMYFYLQNNFSKLLYES